MVLVWALLPKSSIFAEKVGRAGEEAQSQYGWSSGPITLLKGGELSSSARSGRQGAGVAQPHRDHAHRAPGLRWGCPPLVPGVRVKKKAKLFSWDQPPPSGWKPPVPTQPAAEVVILALAISLSPPAPTQGSFPSTSSTCDHSRKPHSHHPSDQLDNQGSLEQASPRLSSPGPAISRASPSEPGSGLQPGGVAWAGEPGVPATLPGQPTAHCPEMAWTKWPKCSYSMTVRTSCLPWPQAKGSNCGLALSPPRETSGKEVWPPELLGAAASSVMWGELALVMLPLPRLLQSRDSAGEH
ncbi:uncharacterized protein LOC116664453 [Camelus ferus]|uniref:Uncharacterized protein LOC116664453 n=1 Tax=Camelus ferus TaxID=419612 RepID=A0A8B8T970_CAMFR|nr:uncharacterized protein LOC116664453 [Camelus ferus]